MIVFRTQSQDCEWAEIPALLAWDVTWEDIERLRKMTESIKSNAADSMVAHAQFEALAVETPPLAKLFEDAGDPEVIRASGRLVKDARPFRQRNANGEIDLSAERTRVAVTRDTVWLECEVKDTNVVVYSEPMPLEKLIELAGFKSKQAA